MATRTPGGGSGAGRVSQSSGCAGAEAGGQREPGRRAEQGQVAQATPEGQGKGQRSSALQVRWAVGRGSGVW